MNLKLNFAGILIALSSIACAAEDPQAMYSAADADQDGVLNEAEAQSVPGLPEQWSEVDANKDGQVDQAEFAQFEIRPAE